MDRSQHRQRDSNFGLRPCPVGRECSSNSADESPDRRSPCSYLDKTYEPYRDAHSLSRHSRRSVDGSPNERLISGGQFAPSPSAPKRITFNANVDKICEYDDVERVTYFGNDESGLNAHFVISWRSPRSNLKISQARSCNQCSRCSWIRFFAMIFLVIFSFAALFDAGHCQSVLHSNSNFPPSPTAISNSTFPAASGVDTSKIFATDQQNRKIRHSAPTLRARTRPHSPLADEQQQKMSKAAFRQLSRLAFKALISEDFQDRPLRPPDDGEAGGEVDAPTLESDRTQMRRQQRKLQRQLHRQLRRRQQLARKSDEDAGDLLPPASDFNHGELIDHQQEDDSSGFDQRGRLPGRRRAVAIATRDSIKPDSCRTVPLKQRVRMTGCTTKIVVNHFCYGQCNSFYIPKLSKKRLRAAFESCSVCRPKTYVPVAITLHCPSRNPPYVKKKIMKVKECSCMPAHVSDNDILQP